MDKIILIFFAICFSLKSNAQTSLDSLRLLLPLGHTDKINTAVFSHDGKKVLTASLDRTFCIWNVQNGKLIFRISGHDSGISYAIFSEDGKEILTASYDNTIRIWSLETGKELDKLNFRNEKIRFLEFKKTHNSVLIHSTKGFVFEWVPNIYKRENRVFKKRLIIVKDDLVSKIIHTGKNKLGMQFVEFTGNKVVLSGLGRISTTALSPDHSKIIAGSINGEIIIIDLKIGKIFQIIKGHSDNITHSKFSPDGKYFITTSSEGLSKLWSLNPLECIKILDVQVLHSITYADFSPDGTLIVTASSDGSARIWNVKNLEKPLFVLKTLHQGIDSLKFSASGLNVLSASTNFSYLNNLSLWNIKNGNTIYSINLIYRPSNLTLINDEICGFSDNNKLLLWRMKDPFIREIHQPHRNLITDINLSLDGKYLTTSSLDSTAIVFEVINNENQVFLKDKYDNASYFHHQDGIYSSLFSDNSRFLVTCSNNEGIAKIYDLAFPNTFILLKGHKDFVYSGHFNKDFSRLVTSSADNTAIVWRTLNGEKIHILNHKGKKMEIVYSAIYSPDYNYILTASSDNTARLWDSESGAQLFVMHHDWGVETAEFSSDGNRILTHSGGNAYLWDVITGKLISIIGSNITSFNSAIINPIYNVVLTNDSKTIVWNSLTGTPIYERIQLGHYNWLVKLPNSPYFMCSKDASKMLHYVTPSLKVIGFEQLDPVYNRPDIVLDSIGKYFGNEDRGMIDEYRKSWEKRIDRLGLDKEKLGKGEIAVPNAEILEADAIAYENKNGKLEIKVAANDPKYPLRRFNVYVNEVPLYGSAGISIAHLKKQVWDTTVSVPLSIGENKIQVSVMNELGLENFKYPSYVRFVPQAENSIQGKTYFIGIGVDKFKDTCYNLNYCVKDVTNLSEIIGKDQKNIQTILLTNKMVTRESILKLKELLQKTNVNDKVIISCSSHGLLDSMKRFYLATEDVDFENPSERGIKYEELEALLDNIPARQKLLLLDACNSGENEIEQGVTLVNKAKSNCEEIAGRGEKPRSNVKRNNEDFMKMNELFVNVRNNTGSVIISAAGGQQSALEGDTVKVDGKSIENGAFTYCVLEYLKMHEGDNEALTVNKLKNYVEKRVEEITNGKQQPTSRQETMEIDWELR